MAHPDCRRRPAHDSGPAAGGNWLAEEVTGWGRARADVVVLLLEPAEVVEFDLGGEAAGVRFVGHPIPDRGVPADRVQSNVLIAALAGAVAAGQGVGIHRRAGIGRWELVAASVLAWLGLPAAEAVRAVAAARGREVPETAGQLAWLGAAD